MIIEFISNIQITSICMEDICTVEDIYTALDFILTNIFRCG